MRLALGIYCVASLACALAPSIELLLTARASRRSARRARSCCPRDRARPLFRRARGRELSLMGAIMALAPVGAPMIGGVLQSALRLALAFLLQIAFG